MSEIEKDVNGFVKDARCIKTQLHNGYQLTLSPGTTDGDYFEEIEYWAKEESILSSHLAFFNFIKDFGLPHKGDCIVDKEEEFLRVTDVYVCYNNEVPEIEIEFQ